MRKKRWCWLLLLWLGLAAGCCGHPELFQRVQGALDTVQGFYDTLLQQEGWQQNDQLRQVVVAADTTLMLAGELQQQWCPDPNQVQQLELQAGEAQKLAQGAGVPTAAAGDKE
jgi:hypothetical protein